MNSDRMLWKSKTSGYKCALLIYSCLILMVGSLIGVILSASSDPSETTLIIGVPIIVIAITFFICSAIVIRKTSLKWEVSNLIFTVTENGIYFTSKGNNSFFFVEWAEIVGYSVKSGKNSKATVTVNFNCLADAGIFGKINYLKMVGIMGVDSLIEIFEEYEIKEMSLSKN
ncbi:MAG: hypothetical protein K2L70_07800 [Clostridia bacterium]|nr:hypothetical protein [Clostridia bacterium]